MQVWNISSHRLVSSPDGRLGAVFDFGFSPDDSVVGIASGGPIEIWSWNEFVPYPQYHIMVIPSEDIIPKGALYDSYSIALSPDGKLMASGMSIYPPGEGPRLAAIFLWDFHSGHVLNILGKGKTDPGVMSFAFNTNSNLLVAGTGDGKVKLWDAKTGALLSTIEGDGYRTYAVAFSPDGNIFAAGSQDGTIKIWETKTGKLLRTIQAHIVRTT